MEWESWILSSWCRNLTTKCKTSQFCRANNQKIINLYILGARGFLVFLRRCHYEKKPLAPKVNLYDKEMFWPTFSWSFLEALISCCFSCSKQYQNDVSLLKKMWIRHFGPHWPKTEEKMWLYLVLGIVTNEFRPASMAAIVEIELACNPSLNPKLLAGWLRTWN